MSMTRARKVLPAGAVLSVLAALSALVSLAGCSTQSHLLYRISVDPEKSGQQWVWPYFLDRKPTVIAFWTTDEMQCERDVAALKTLDMRPGSVQLVTVVTGRDRLEIEKWMRRDRITYVVLLDLEEEFARRLGVYDYPTFLYFDTDEREISRVEDVRLVHNWFDRPRWLEKAGAVAPSHEKALGAVRK